jgi:RimJ/RimL family protein N-acetyltransferase
MNLPPHLTTPRLLLRPFTLSDAAAVQTLAGNPAIAEMTLNIPHPYPDGAAAEWISTHTDNWQQGRSVTYAITLRDDDTLIGCISLGLHPRQEMAEMGYWLGQPYWNEGYGTEAAAALLEFGFNQLNLNRIYAYHLPRNPASGRIMQKIGMTYEGLLRQAAKKDDTFEDLILYAILREDFLPD